MWIKMQKNNKEGQTERDAYSINAQVLKKIESVGKLQ